MNINLKKPSSNHASLYFLLYLIWFFFKAISKSVFLAFQIVKNPLIFVKILCQNFHFGLIFNLIPLKSVKKI